MVGMTTKTSAIDHGERAERGDRTMRNVAIHHDGVTIPVSRGGQGQPLVLCPRLNATQTDSWK
jgi:esterase